MTSDFEEALGRALAAWNEKGRLADLAAPLFEWLMRALKAERVFLVMAAAGGGYRVRTCRNVDGEAISDPERWISHFAVHRALGQGRATYFADTRLDRRFRTEGEVEAGVKARSIVVVPLRVSDLEGVLYCDSRFVPIEWGPGWSHDGGTPIQIVVELLRGALRTEATETRRRVAERALRTAREAGPAPPPRSSNVSRPAPREFEFHGFVTASAPLVATLDELRRVARSSLPILIHGESGTGKEVLARAVHAESGRAGPFVSLHCASVPSSLVEIELFGHKAGAFTGAERDREGLFQQANGGTIFLDEVEEMPSEMQLAFLRILETGRFRPVSGDAELEVDVRVISTSQHSLHAGGHGDLRDDLYYRLAGAEFRIPPLRERREDILLLLRRFLAVGLEGGQHRPPAVSPQAEDALVAYGWPGNVRELQNLVRRLIALGASDLTREHVEHLAVDRRAPGEPSGDGPRSDMRTVVDRAERQAIVQALADCGGNKSLAARRLGLSRKTFYRRLEKHGIAT
ncbi:MAG: sigma-54 interaction domain-containing protein [Planctomycetota bacterium]